MITKKVFDTYKERDNYQPYEHMTCPICRFKKFRTVFFLNRHCKKYHNMNLKDALKHRMKRLPSLQQRISHVAYGIS